MDELNRISRRHFLRQTFAYSAIAAMGSGGLLSAAAQAPPPDPNATHLFMIGDWGTDRYVPQQVSVSQSMQMWMDRNHLTPNAMLLLGDNWYGKLHGGVNDHRWADQFENMYPANRFPGPAFAVLGNHDYEKGRTDKVQLQLDYPKSRQTRWTMPARWYTKLYPEQNPVAKFIFLDSNLPGTKPFDPWPWSYLMSHEDADAQDQWFRAELAKPREVPFLIVVCHHPLFTNGVHRDNPVLIPRWDPLLRQARVDFYITGHDHDLQHLEFEGHPTSFVVSGGGGAELVDWSVKPSKRGPFGGKVLGFSHLELTREAATLRHITLNAQELHTFRKTPDGRMTILKSS